ncbi:MAG TPA: BatD family protein [Bacteroidales bacterium]|nr:BatD family protein [Bacteroidales bacterium]
MKSTLLTMVYLLTALSLAAQETTLTVDAPPNAAAGERFRIVYTVNSTDGRFLPPSFDPSFTVSGPQSSTSRNVQWINGQMNSTSTTTLIYYVVASTPGKYTVAPAQYETKKVTVSCLSVEIEITAEGSATSRSTQGISSAQGGRQGREAAPASGSELSLRLLLSTREVYVGQPITATLKLYTRINLSGINDLKNPDFKGFLREDIETPPLRTLESEVIDGVQYGTGVLQRFVLYPQISGELRIDTVHITALVQQRTGASDPFFSDPFFDNFFSNVTTVAMNVSTRPAVIKVKPLPAPQPADFHGAVGSFELTSSLSKTDVEVNDAMTFTLTLKGTGNLNLAGEPVINFPQGIEKYDPKVTVKSSGTSTGTKTFEFLLIPRNTGTFELPPVSYTVFDATQEKYVTLRTAGYTVKVTGSTGAGETATPVNVPGADVKYLGQDIRYIRNGQSRLGLMTSPLVSRTYYWLWFALALFLTAVVLLLRREQMKHNADITGLRNRKASKVARRRLSKARSLLDTGKPEMVNAELAKALWGYLGDKLAIALSDLTKEKCYTSLRERKVEEGVITELDLILSATEYSRYSPSSEGERPDGLYKRAAALLGKLDNVLD